MSIRDWATFFVTLGGAFGWFYAWWKHREYKLEMRGVRGYKFRAMWREYAGKHGIPINGEDTEKEEAL